MQFGRSGGHIAHLRRKACAQLFFWYQALNTGEPTPLFLHQCGLFDRNVVFIRDPERSDFVGGLGPDFPTRQALIDWHVDLCAREPQVQEVYCVGNSSGGYSALLFGSILKANAVWAFSPRTWRDKKGAWEELLPHIAANAGATQFHLYFDQSDKKDRAIADALETFSGVELHPHRSDHVQWGHLIMVDLLRSGRLKGLFPPFRGS